MKPSDPSITWLEAKPLGLAERLYLPLFVSGLATTARHLVSPKVTVSYPGGYFEVRDAAYNVVSQRNMNRAVITAALRETTRFLK